MLDKDFLSQKIRLFFLFCTQEKQDLSICVYNLPLTKKNLCKLYLKTVFSIKEKPAAPQTSHLPLISYYSQKMSAVHRPTYCYFHSQNTKPVTQLLGWNKISSPPPPFFSFGLEWPPEKNKVSKSHFRKFLSTCSQQVNQFFLSVNVSWVTVLLRDEIINYT